MTTHKTTTHFEEINSVRNHYNPRILTHETAAREYAQISVKSLVTINAGVAVAYPTLTQVFIKHPDLDYILLPTSCAIIGVILAILCSYSAYFNHTYAGYMDDAQLDIDILSIDEKFDQHTFHRFQKARANNKEHWKYIYNKYEKLRDLTFWSGNLTGIFSLLCFIVSVITFSRNIIQ